MKIQMTGFVLGAFLIAIGALQIIPALTDYSNGHTNAQAFFMSFFLCMFIGGGLLFSNNIPEKKLSLREGFLMTLACWTILPSFIAIPYFSSEMGLTFIDAYFESVSGLTTTGSTAIADIESQSDGIKLWRSMTQWVGGMGILAFVIILLPTLQIGGMGIFKIQGADKNFKEMPKTEDIIKAIISIYLLIGFICAVLYKVLGMHWFDAINHAMTTVSTGGFSIYNDSFSAIDSNALKLTAILFMVLAALPFTQFLRMVYQGKFGFFRDSQIQIFLGLIIISTLVLFTNNMPDQPLHQTDHFMNTLFNTASILSTTGFYASNYTLWGGFSVMAFMLMLYIGGCGGSTAGGLKIIRIILVAKSLKRQLRSLLYPHGVFHVHYQENRVEMNVIIAALTFLSLYVVSNVFLTMALALSGLDFLSALSASAAAIGNVGPGLGPIIGPAGDFGSLNDISKILLSAGMILGRLEIMSVVVLFSSRYWQK